MKRASRNFENYSPQKLHMAEPGMASIPYNGVFRELENLISSRNKVSALNNYPLDNGANRFLKRLADILISFFVILFILSWLIPLVALLIKLDSKGPVFFIQQRNKRNGRLFSCIKFRSMIPNDDADILPAVKNDKRITKTGLFLRNYYIDELPQFINVFFGDMSLIGPRPHMVSDNILYDDLIRNYGYRHRVKPGITGLAQVMGYLGVAEDINKMRDRVHMDIFYVRHWSLKMDISIFLHTIGKAIGL